MKLEHIAKRLPPTMDQYQIVGFDTETFLISHTGEVPRLVCGTFALPETPCVDLFKNKLVEVTDDLLDQTLILDATATVSKFKELLSRRDYIIAIHNAQFDLLVLLKQDFSLLVPIVKALKDGRIVCTAIAQAMMNASLPSLHMHSQVSLLESMKPYLSEDKYKHLKKIKDGEKSKKVDDTPTLFDDQPKKKGSIRTSFGDLIDTPIDEWDEVAVAYAKEDAIFVRALLYTQWGKSCRLASNKAMHFLEDVPRQTYADFVLAFASVYTGIHLDRTMHATADRELEIRQAELATQIVGKGYMIKDKEGYKIPPKPLQDQFVQIYDKLKVAKKDRKLTTGGDISIDEEATENLIFLMNKASGEDFKDILETLDLIDEYRDITKQRNTYLKNFAKAFDCEDHRLRYRFKGYGAGTGRTSSSEPNLQNLPRSGSVRNVIRASKGHILGLCDYSNAEMRTLSQIHLDEGRDSILAKRYKDDPNFDPHLFVSAQFCGVTYEQAIEYYGDKKHPLYKDLKEKRNLAKVLNFGLAGGLGVKSFISYAKGYGFKGANILKFHEVDKSIKAWKQVYSEMVDYFKVRAERAPKDEEIYRRNLAWDDGAFRSVYQYPRSNRFRFCDGYTNGCNSPFQGMASDGAKNALILVFEECMFSKLSPLFGSRIVCFIHDEIIIEIPVSDIDAEHYTQQGKDAVDRLSQLMKQGMEIMTPDIQAVCETTLSYRWDKEAHSPTKGDRQQVYVSKVDQKI
jgi:DNA polymerase I-like protein with 3'-5' exonuclease and polymerase domains